MKIQCDDCCNAAASLFCTADEAALCSSCDLRVHRANKLSGSHCRLPLLHSPPSSAPCCDVCHERRAFLFCREDRVILCRDCDLRIHSVNEHTRKHSRFLLAGVKLALPETENGKKMGTDAGGEPEKLQLSEYFIETLPGWQVEDLLGSPSMDALSKRDDDLLPFLEADLSGDFAPHGWATGLPQVPQFCPSPAVDRGVFYGVTEEVGGVRGGKQRGEDAVPVLEIGPPLKRARLISFTVI